jgi:hypothetical protein
MTLDSEIWRYRGKERGFVRGEHAVKAKAGRRQGITTVSVIASWRARI